MRPRFRLRGKQGHVRSLAEFVDVASRVTSVWCRHVEFIPWFRGQHRASRPLLPSLYRDENRRVKEFDCRFDFKYRGLPLLDGAAREPKSEWDWYFLMQHHGVPTRLLDWSESALVALYFAVADSSEREDAAVWMLDPWAINVRIANIGKRIFGGEDPELQPYLPSVYGSKLPDPPVALQAPYASRRIAAQKSCFTLHGSDRTPLNKYPQLASRLYQIVIAKGAIRRIQRALELSGVTQSTVFPDLSNLAAELLRYWR